MSEFGYTDYWVGPAPKVKKGFISGYPHNMIIIDDDEQISPPKPSTCFHRYKGFPDVLSKNWYDWHLSIKGDLSKALSLFPHDRVLVGTKLTLVPTTRGNSDKVTLMKKRDKNVTKGTQANRNGDE